MSRSSRSFALAALAALAACEIPPASEYVGGTASSDAGGCTGAHVYFDPSGGHCYRFESALLAWSPAESDCVGWGGHLVAINSADEQVFVANIINAEVSDASTGAWIGLTNAKTSAYGWSTGEPLTFEDWGTNAPTGKPCAFAYTVKFSNHWDDYQCNVQASYVCER